MVTRLRFETFIFLAVLLLLCATNCARVSRVAETTYSYHTDTYKGVFDAWSRQARIHSGFQVELIVSASYKSVEFRRAYAQEYAHAYKLTTKEEERFLADQLKAATLEHEFLMASFVPDKKWDDFDKANSMWKIYLVNDNDERVVPVEVKKVKDKTTVTAHFFPYVTPWKSAYTVRFPNNIPATNEAIVKGHTKTIKVVIASVLGTAEMVWNLE